MSTTRAQRTSLDQLLRIEAGGDDSWRARLHDGFGPNAFGADVLARAVLVAADSCPGMEIHSLHGTFVKPVPTDRWVDLRVEKIQDGKRFARRRVRLWDGDRALFELTASLTNPAAQARGSEFQEATMPVVPPPEALPDQAEVAEREGWTDGPPDEISWRFVGEPYRPVQAGEASRWLAWAKPNDALSQRPGIHAAALAFLSDFWSHWAIARRLALSFDPTWLISLDTAIWFHHRPDWSDWLLVDSRTDACHGGRALIRRDVYARSGAWVTSMLQEALITT